MELTFTPATIRDSNGVIPYSDAETELTIIGNPLGDALYSKNIEWAVDLEDRLLIDVPAGHDTVFTVGPYTITLDV